MKKSRLDILKELLSEDMDNSFVRFAIAKEYEKLGNIEEAIKVFLTLKEKDKQYVGLYYHLAKLYEQTGAVEQAKDIYQSGIAIAQKTNDLHALSELRNAMMNLTIS